MITAVDTNILLDVFVPSEQHGRQSRQWLAHAAAEADVFLTRDRGFFASYFPEIKSPDAR